MKLAIHPVPPKVGQTTRNVVVAVSRCTAHQFLAFLFSGNYLIAPRSLLAHISHYVELALGHILFCGRQPVSSRIESAYSTRNGQRVCVLCIGPIHT